MKTGVIIADFNYFFNGAPGWIRTSDLELRSLLLYPTELPGLMVRDTGVEPVSKVWKTFILTAIRIPHVTELLYQNYRVF